LRIANLKSRYVNSQFEIRNPQSAIAN